MARPIVKQEQGCIQRAAVSVIQIKTSHPVSPGATGCVWTTQPWPELRCPAWHSIHLKPITWLLLWSPSRKWQWSLWWRGRASALFLSLPQPSSSGLHSLSFPLTWLFCPLVAVVLIGVITVLATQGWKGGDRWGPMQANWFRKCFAGQVKVKGKLVSCHTLTI